MKKKIITILLLLFIFIPFKVFALSNNYEDKIANIVNINVEDNKINYYLFHGAECPHCEEEREWIESIKEKYSDKINFYYYEVWHDIDNAQLMLKVKDELNITQGGVPLAIIGDKYYNGFSDTIKSQIQNTINEYLEIEKSNKVNIPILGDINMKEVSIPLVAVILGFIDGFNPCAMWILLFLINMLFRIEDKKKAWFLGLLFLFVSGLVYFMSMLGINLVVSVITIQWIKILLALFILVAGILNFRKYLKTRKEEAGCTVVDDKKRKKLTTKMKKIIESKSFNLAIIGIITLAVSVNLIELACSLGFPLIFTEILSINNINGIAKFIYLIIYIIFYLIDDIVVFSISMFTLEATGITNKYNKLCTLISAIIMIAMGLLLLFKPEWLMLNF